MCFSLMCQPHLVFHCIASLPKIQYVSVLLFLFHLCFSVFEDRLSLQVTVLPITWCWLVPVCDMNKVLTVVARKLLVTTFWRQRCSVTSRPPFSLVWLVKTWRQEELKLVRLTATLMHNWPTFTLWGEQKTASPCWLGISLLRRALRCGNGSLGVFTYLANKNDSDSVRPVTFAPRPWDDYSLLSFSSNSRRACVV